MQARRIALAVAGLFVGQLGSAGATTVVFTDFTDVSTLTLNGATATIGNPVFFGGQNVLRLTNDLSQGGSAFLTNPISLDADVSFSTFFEFQISDPGGIGDADGQGADGLAFVVQTVASNVGGGGGGLGYAGIPNSLGVEFDTYFNGFAVDPDGNHVGIDLNGNIASVSTASVSPRLNDGDIWYAWVDYDGVTDLLEVRLSLLPVRPSAALLSAIADLPAILGSTDAFVGFTSGTGAGSGDHDIRAWEFRDSFEPIGAVPEPSTVALLGAGLVSLALRARRRR